MKNGLANVTFDFKNHKHVVNNALNDLRNNISQLSHIPAFNSLLNGTDVTTCTSALVKHRIINKFCIPTRVGSQIVKLFDLSCSTCSWGM